MLLLKLFSSRGDGLTAAENVFQRHDNQDTVTVDGFISSEARVSNTVSASDLPGDSSGDLDAPAEIVVPATDLCHGAWYRSVARTTVSACHAASFSFEISREERGKW